MGMQKYTRLDIYSSIADNEELRPDAAGEFVRHADAQERERVLREALEGLCTELEYVHEAASAIEEEDVRCLIRTSEGEAAIKQARAALAQ